MVLTIVETTETPDATTYEQFVDFIAHPNAEDQLADETPDLNYFTREGVRNCFLGEPLDEDKLSLLDENSRRIISGMYQELGVLIKNVYGSSFEICRTAMEVAPDRCARDFEKQRIELINLISSRVPSEELEQLMISLGLVARRHFMQSNSWE